MFDNVKYNISCFLDGNLVNISSEKSISQVNIKIKTDILNNDKAEILNFSLIPEGNIILKDVYITLPFSFNKNHKIYSNGYQSWTDSREFSINERLRGISKLAAPITKKYQFDKYGDYSFKDYSREKGDIHGYTYSYIRDGENYSLLGSLTEKYGFTIIEEKVKENKIYVYKDCRGLNINKEYPIFQLIFTKGSCDEIFDEYFKLLNISKREGKSMTGWTSWYNHYQNISENIILENLNNYKDKNKKIDIFQIDDGYQTAVGDWLSIDNTKFPNGMDSLAKKIKEDGYKAGIWLAPFVCETKSKIFKYKKDWLLKDTNGQLIMAGSNWSGFYPLDIYNPEVREYIKNFFSVILNDWCYDMVKLDFLYAVCLVPRENKTRGQIMCESMDFLRDCVGNKLILGCGVPLGPSFGKVDYCRIGCDVSLDWNDKWFMRFFHRERISTLNAIKNSIGRRHLNGRAFLNDPDVFLLRDNNIILTKNQKETLLNVNRLFGSIIFTSDNIKEYDPIKEKLFDYIMEAPGIKIQKVTNTENNLIEVLFIENQTSHIAIINLSRLELIYDNKYKLIEILPSNENKMIKEYSIKMEPYKTRIFQIENKI